MNASGGFPVRVHTVLTLGMAAMLLTAGAWAQAPVTLGLDGRTNSNPTIAALGDFVTVSWSAAEVSSMDLYLATSRDGGRSFSPPVRVNSVPGQARLSGDMPARIALLPRSGKAPEVLITWSAKSGDNWQLLQARSLDGGATFGRSELVPGSDAPGVRGWHSMTVDASGVPSVLWVDHRATVAVDDSLKKIPQAERPKADPTERAQLSWVYHSRFDGSAPTRVAPSVCYCCKTTLVSAGKATYAVWRNVYPGSERDIAFARSDNGGRTFSAPVRVSPDHWQIDGCPDDGPALAVDGRGAAHVVWPTALSGKGTKVLTLYHAMTRDGKGFTPRAALPVRGPAGHPQVVAEPAGGILVAWDEVIEGERTLAMARLRSSANGKPTFVPVKLEGTKGQQRYPSLAVSSGGSMAAWVQQVEKTTTIQVARVP